MVHLKRGSFSYGGSIFHATGRLIGVGHNKLELYHATLNIPSPASARIFAHAQADLLTTVKFSAEQSMAESVKQLRTVENISNSEYLRTMVSYDGAYQQRSGKSGGGFSRYCFAAAISVQTGTVLSYDVACNSCKICSENANQYRCESITLMNSKKKYKRMNQIALPSTHLMHLCSWNLP